MHILVVTAVPAERDAVTACAPGPPEESALPGGYAVHRIAPKASGGLLLDVLAAGVGPAAAAAGTATALTAAACRGLHYDLVVSAGIGGGFRRPDGAGAPVGSAPVGSAVVAEEIVAADLGAQTDEGFVPVTALGFGRDSHRPPQALVRAVAEATGAAPGAVLTGSTVTGSAERASELMDRHPRALAEAMEGFGVAEAAAAHGVAVLELRTISNPVGPRDRAAWRIGEALGALTAAFGRLPRALNSWRTP